ncbi:hypothetical protein BDV32DRAFT_145343 [Aspergillus pseudonomiae]|nr:hypothetical protein BDV32DRAFT_145343 [Aspergillus pseudonomiae]
MSVGSIQKVANVFNPAGFANFAWGATAYQDYVPGDVEHFKACKVIEWIVSDLPEAIKALQGSDFKECPNKSLHQQMSKGCLVEHFKHSACIPDYHFHADGGISLNLYTMSVLPRAWSISHHSQSVTVHLYSTHMAGRESSLQGVRMFKLHHFIETRLIALARTICSREPEELRVAQREDLDYYTRQIIKSYPWEDLKSGLDRRYLHTGLGIVEIAVSEHKIQDACKQIHELYRSSLHPCDSGNSCYLQPLPAHHFHLKEDKPGSVETSISLHRMPTLFTGLPTQIPNNAKPESSNYVLVTDDRLPNSSGSDARGSSEDHNDTLRVGRTQSTAKVLTLARHTESLILRLCLNIDTDSASVFFKAIEDILLRDLGNGNAYYEEYMRKQKSDWKQERSIQEQYTRQNIIRWVQRKKYVQMKLCKKPNQRKPPSNKSSASLNEGNE